MERMELRHLRYFLAVIDAGGMTRAAAALHVSQPTLSQQMRDLETELGAPLLERRPRGVVPTEAGAALALRARRALAEIAAAREDLAALTGLRTGALRVGIVVSLCSSLAPSVTARFHAAYPGVRLAVADGLAPEIEAALAEGALDLGVIYGPPERGDITAEFLFEEELVLVVRRDHPLSVPREALPLAALAGVKLILPNRRSATRRLVEACCAAAGITANVAVEMDAIEPLVRTIAASDLASVLSVRAIPPGVAAVTRPLRDPRPLRPVQAVVRAGALPSVAAREFLELFRAAAAG